MTPSRPRSGLQWPALLALASCLAGCGAADGGRPDRAELPPPRPAVVQSNVLRADYAGSAVCRGCHRDIAETWAASPMHRMTREVATADVEAPFDGASMRYRDEIVRMVAVGGRRYVRLETPGRDDRLWRVTKVIGGRTREDFAGVAVSDTGAGTSHGTEEVVLPATWVFGTREWRYKGYSVMTPERPHLAAGPTWRRTCILCHNTAPRIVSVYDDLIGEGAPPYQGNSTDDLLPDALRWRWTVGDESAAAGAVREEIARLGEEPLSGDTSVLTLAIQASDATYRGFGPDDLVEIGIGCEACHNGAREHAGDPRVLPSLEVRGPALSFGPTGGPATEAERVNRTCARCHSVLFSGYPRTWEGGERDGSPGGSFINSGEARDFLLGGCSRELACTRCHDPHAADRRERLDALGTAQGNALCVECHADLGTDGALRAHSHHEPGTGGAACVGCHMPRKNLGLGYRLTRYHHIGSPTDPERVERDRPLECALCHTDATVASLVETMERWWGHRYDREALTALYGEDLAVGALPETVRRGLPHEQAVAVMALAEGGDTDALPLTVVPLESDYPLVRYWAREAMAQLTGDRPPLDMSLPGPELRRAAQTWLDER